MSDDDFYEPKGNSATRSKCGRSKFTPEEDKKLIELAEKYPNNEQDWVFISSKMPKRSIRQCRERWKNYLDPSLDRSEWTPQQDELLMEKVDELGPSWNAIGRFFERSGSAVRNRYLVISRKQMKIKLEKAFPKEDLVLIDRKPRKHVKKVAEPDLVTEDLINDINIQDILNLEKIGTIGGTLPLDFFF